MTTCAHVQGLAPEASLGLLSGVERAEVLAHLDACDECRELVAELTVVADSLVQLSPHAEPGPGFDARVVRELDRHAPVRRRRLVAAAVAAAIVVLVTGFAVGRANDGSTATREVAMHTPGGREVGDAYVHDGRPPWIVVAVPGWTDDSTEYHLRVTYRDGTTSDAAGGGTWATSVTNVDDVRTVELVDADGKVWCSATI